VQRLAAPGKVRLWMDCAWRVSSQEGVIAASLDSAELILSRLGILKDLVVEEIDVAPGCWDLKLTLSNGTLIEGFCHSLEDEMWELRRADGLRLGIGPGLKVEERYEAED